MRVERLGQDVVRGDGEHEHGGADGEPGPVRRGIGTDEGVGEQPTGQEDVHVDEEEQRRVPHARRVEAGAVEQPEPADGEDGGHHGMGHGGHRPRPQHRGDLARCRHRQRPQRQRHRGGEDEQQRSEHPEQDVADQPGQPGSLVPGRHSPSLSGR